MPPLYTALVLSIASCCNIYYIDVYLNYDFSGRGVCASIPNSAVATSGSFPLTITINNSFANFQPQYIRSYYKTDATLVSPFASTEFTTFTEYFTIYLVKKTSFRILLFLTVYS